MAGTHRTLGGHRRSRSANSSRPTSTTSTRSCRRRSSTSARRCAPTTPCSIRCATRAWAEEYAREQIQLEEQHIAEVEKMMRKPGPHAGRLITMDTGDPPRAASTAVPRLETLAAARADPSVASPGHRRCCRVRAGSGGGSRSDAHNCVGLPASPSGWELREPAKHSENRRPRTMVHVGVDRHKRMSQIPVLTADGELTSITCRTTSRTSSRSSPSSRRKPHRDRSLRDLVVVDRDRAGCASVSGARSASRLQGPRPAAARNSERKQKSTTTSPRFKMGQKLLDACATK